MVWAREENGRIPTTRWVLMAAAELRARGRPRICWIDGVKVVLGSRMMTADAARQLAKGRKKRRALLHM